jgi:hypothetical protein
MISKFGLRFQIFSGWLDKGPLKGPVELGVAKRHALMEMGCPI